MAPQFNKSVVIEMQPSQLQGRTEWEAIRPPIFLTNIAVAAAGLFSSIVDDRHRIDFDQIVG
ncbi:hypothetical protein GCM10010981_32730 [Dyella nitratireducens]|uniref:Uncharacterized protein n=1 Tax=Dyella nitratireducens TaxID=1849580 RepID=A0ABQ1GC90_9GAMM|nr:hypothetical protein GCM10010981_32730 [Dyella nitratireducens]